MKLKRFSTFSVNEGASATSPLKLDVLRVQSIDDLLHAMVMKFRPNSVQKQQIKNFLTSDIGQEDVITNIAEILKISDRKFDEFEAFMKELLEEKESKQLSPTEVRSTLELNTKEKAAASIPASSEYEGDLIDVTDGTHSYSFVWKGGKAVLLNDWYGGLGRKPKVAIPNSKKRNESDEKFKLKRFATINETGEANQDYDHELFDEIVSQLGNAGIKGATHKEFDKYQGVYIRIPKVGTYWIKEVYLTGEHTDESKNKKYRKAVLVSVGQDGWDNEYSANRRDYWNLPNEHEFTGQVLILSKADGKTDRIENPKVKDLPDLKDIRSTIQYKPGTEVEHIIFNREDDTETEIEVTKTEDGKVDASDLITNAKSTSKRKNESIDEAGKPLSGNMFPSQRGKQTPEREEYLRKKYGRTEREKKKHDAQEKSGGVSFRNDVAEAISKFAEPKPNKEQANKIERVIDYYIQNEDDDELLSRMGKSKGTEGHYLTGEDVIKDRSKNYMYIFRQILMNEPKVSDYEAWFDDLGLEEPVQESIKWDKTLLGKFVKYKKDKVGIVIAVDPKNREAEVKSNQKGGGGFFWASAHVSDNTLVKILKDDDKETTDMLKNSDAETAEEVRKYFIGESATDRTAINDLGYGNPKELKKTILGALHVQYAISPEGEKVLLDNLGDVMFSMKTLEVETDGRAIEEIAEFLDADAGDVVDVIYNSLKNNRKLLK